VSGQSIYDGGDATGMVWPWPRHFLHHILFT